jgi:hypothetical protein
MFHSHLLYCPIILSCTSQTSLNKISTLQKKAIRIITKSKVSILTSPLFLDTKILPFEKLLTQAKLLFMHFIAYNYASNSFSNIWATNASRNNEYLLRNADLLILPTPELNCSKNFPSTLYPYPGMIHLIPYVINIIGLHLKLPLQITSLQQ